MISLILCYLGWTFISGTTSRHKRNWPVAAGRFGGAILLAAAFAVNIANDGWHVGPVYWCCALSASAALHVLFLWLWHGRYKHARVDK